MVSKKPLIDDAGLLEDFPLQQRAAGDLLVTIVCVTYNAAGNLPALLSCVKEQRTADTEFIVIDGGSTDGTLKLLEDSQDIVDFWVSNPDNGIYDAMNKAVNYAHGRWILFMGADDYLLDGFARALTELKDANTVYYGNLLFYGKPFYRQYDDYYLTKLNICQQSIFYPATVFSKYRFDLKYQVYADYHLNLRCWKDSQFKFEHISHMIAHFSDGGFSSYTKDEAFEKDRDMLFKKHLKRKSYYRYLNRTIGFKQMAHRFLRDVWGSRESQ